MFQKLVNISSSFLEHTIYAKTYPVFVWSTTFERKNFTLVSPLTWGRAGAGKSQIERSLSKIFWTWGITTRVLFKTDQCYDIPHANLLHTMPIPDQFHHPLLSDKQSLDSYNIQFSLMSQYSSSKDSVDPLTLIPNWDLKSYAGKKPS